MAYANTAYGGGAPRKRPMPTRPHRNKSVMDPGGGRTQMGVPPVPGTTTPTGGGPGQFNLADFLKNYLAPLGSISDAYTRSFDRGGPIDIPSFQELFGSYRDVAERETARQAAQLNETYGSLGARYGSDIGRQQGQLRKDLGVDLSRQAGDILQSLRKQQFGEASFFSGQQANALQNALSLMFSDFLRRTGPPPLLGSATNAPGGYQQPSTYFT